MLRGSETSCWMLVPLAILTLRFKIPVSYYLFLHSCPTLERQQGDWLVYFLAYWGGSSFVPDFLDLDVSYFKFCFCLPGVHIFKAEHSGLWTKLPMFKIPTLAPANVAQLVGMLFSTKGTYPGCGFNPLVRAHIGGGWSRFLSRSSSSSKTCLWVRNEK